MTKKNPDCVIIARGKYLDGKLKKKLLDVDNTVKLLHDFFCFPSLLARSFMLDGAVQHEFGIMFDAGICTGD